MVSVMRVDVSPRPHFYALIGIASLVVIIAIIIGATGPPEFDSTTYYAYDCLDNSHVWNDETCGGVIMADNESWVADVNPLAALNRFWTLQFMIYTLQTGDVQRTLDVEVTVYGRNSPDMGIPYTLLYTRNTSQDVVCSGGPGPCNPLVLVDEQELSYTYYTLSVSILNGFQYADDTAPFVGDVKFVIWNGHAGYSSMELVLRILFLLVAAVALVAFLWWMRTTQLEDWAWEQKALVILLIGILLLNNPFYGLRYAVKGWFFHFLDKFFAVLYLSVFLLFGLLILDKIRLEDVRMEFSRQHIPKYVVVGIFGLLSTILFAWVDIRNSYDPILGHAKLLSGIAVLFYIVATVYAGILIWLAVLVVMTVPVATAKPYLMTRFLFVAIPTSFNILSILIGIFNGTFGPLNESTLSMVFFLTIYNLYVWILIVGFWPIIDRYRTRNPSEADSIIHFESTYNRISTGQ